MLHIIYKFKLLVFTASAPKVCFATKLIESVILQEYQLSICCRSSIWLQNHSFVYIFNVTIPCKLHLPLGIANIMLIRFYYILHKFPRCKNSLKISRSGRTDLADATLYCGFVGRFDETSINNRMTIQFLTDSFSFGSRFQCRLSLTPDSCECGRRNTGRVVGGNEVGIKIATTAVY